MIVGLQERRARGRRRLLWGIAKTVLSLALAAALGFYIYTLGKRAGGREANGLRQEVAVLNATVAELQAQAAAPAAPQPDPHPQPQTPEVQSAAPPADPGLLDRLLERNAELEAQISGTGGAAGAAPDEIAALVHQKLEAGVPPERLKAALEAISAERSCDAQPVAKRFVVATPVRRDAANGSVTFADGAITVSAEGPVPPGATGTAAVRFDPQQAVTIRFALRGGAASEAKGVLPLQHSVMVGGREHRFTAEAGDPGLMRITDAVCPAP